MASEAIRTDSSGEVGEEQINDWVERACAGDARAFESLYRELHGRVFALCFRMTGREEEAEELTQDAFVRAWEKMDTFRGDSRFSTWLHRLTVNVVLQHRRSSARRSAKETAVDDPTVFERAVRRVFPGTKIDLERAISGLPDGAKRMLVLRDIHGFAYQEIADRTGVTLGTVKAQIHRARKLVQEAMER